MKIKRVLAYIIDIFIVSIISAAIFMLPIFKNEYNEYNEIYNEYNELLLNSGSSDVSIEQQENFIYNTSKSSQSLMIITSGLLFCYFGILAYILKGQTIGKKIMKIKIVSNNEKELNPNLFILRAILVTNLIPRIISIIALAYLKQSAWLEIENIITIISNTITFLIIGFIIFRDDERGLHDIICNTKVISTNNK